MKHILILAMIFSTAVFAADVPKAKLPQGTVTAGVLNVRVRPSSKSDAILQLKRGDTVVIVEKNDEWTAIRPPENSSLYISSPLIADGKLISASNLRSGPGVNFQSLGVLPKGTPVTVIEDKNSWSRIEVPNVDIKCYVATRYIKIEAVENTAEKKPEKTPAIPKPVIKKGDIVSFDSDSLQKIQKDYLKGSAKKITVEGKLQSTTLSSYMLITAKQNYHLAGIIPGNIDLTKNVQVQGVSNIVRGWKSPVLEIKKISNK